MTFFFLQKISKMSVPRGELFFLSFLVQQNAGDFSKVRKFFDEFVRGILSLSLSLSVFVVAFHQTHLIPVKDRQTDRRFVLSLCLSVSLSLTLCLVRLVSQDGNLMSPFSWERIETPLQLSNYWRRRPGKQTDRQTDRRMSSLSLCLSVSFVWYLKKRIWCLLFPREKWDPPPPNYPIIIGGEEDWEIS